MSQPQPRRGYLLTELAESRHCKTIQRVVESPLGRYILCRSWREGLHLVMMVTVPEGVVSSMSINGRLVDVAAGFDFARLPDAQLKDRLDKLGIDTGRMPDAS